MSRGQVPAVEAYNPQVPLPHRRPWSWPLLEAVCGCWQGREESTEVQREGALRQGVLGRQERVGFGIEGRDGGHGRLWWWPRARGSYCQAASAGAATGWGGGMLSQPLWPGCGQIRAWPRLYRGADGALMEVTVIKAQGGCPAARWPIRPCLEARGLGGQAGRCRGKSLRPCAGSLGSWGMDAACPCVSCVPSLWGGVRWLLPSAAAAAPEKCPLGVAEGLSLLAAGPRGVSGTRPQVRDLGLRFNAL